MESSVDEGDVSSCHDEQHQASASEKKILEQFVNHINESIQNSLLQVADQFGVEISRTNDFSMSNDMRVVVQELHTLRRKERDLSSLVDDLHTKQRVTKEKLAMYSILAFKLQRELINEKLAHIDTKKELELLGTQSTQTSGECQDQDSPMLQSTDKKKAQCDSNKTTSEEEDEDPWTSPGKTDKTTNANVPLSFGSFYLSQQSHHEIEDETEHTTTSGDPESLRSSLNMGQFLPSSLLDSPQHTPTARSIQENISILDDTEEMGFKQPETIESGEGLFTFTQAQQTNSCDGCERNRVVAKVVDCGHLICRSCEQSLLELTIHRQCPSCKKPVLTLQQLDNNDQGDNEDEEDNQVSHLQGERASPSSSITISPLTLSLFSELFERIEVEELEVFLTEAGGDVSTAIDLILHRHPSFNPLLGSSTAASSNQQQLQQSTVSVNPSNWKTEMCMYYLQGKCNKTRRTCSFAHGESDLARPTNTNTLAKPNSTLSTYKSRMCPLWLEGNCVKSRRECSLAHGENDLRESQTSNLSTGVGQSSTLGGSGNTGGNAGSSLPSSLPTTAPRLQNYKTELCYYYLKGCCNYTKDECRFAHGESDMRTVESNTLEWSAQLTGGSTANTASSSSIFTNEVYNPLLPDKMSLTLSQQQFQQQYVQQFQQPHQQSMTQPAFGMSHHHMTQVPSPFMAPGNQQYQVPPPQTMHHHVMQSSASMQSNVFNNGGGPGINPMSQFRYIKPMDEVAKQQSRVLTTRSRRESSWSQNSYDPMASPEF